MGPFYRTATLLLTAITHASSLSPILPQNFTYPGDAPYNTTVSTLSSALSCPYGLSAKASKPVLLVHGTGTDGFESWSATYTPALHLQGFTPCWIDLPIRGYGDMQVAAAYVAYNIHQISYEAGGVPIDVIGHSQGNPNIQWALHFWPSTRQLIKSFVGLAPDFTGIQNTQFECQDNGNTCVPAYWQQAIVSHYYTALHSQNGLRTYVPTTAAWSNDDGIITPPAPNAELTGGVAISIQDICPNRTVGHVSMLADAVAFAIAADALSHEGHASTSRIIQTSPNICNHFVGPGMNILALGKELPAGTSKLTLPGELLGQVLSGLIPPLGIPVLNSEPPLLPYAVAAIQS